MLIITQAVDLDDPILGFFHRWIQEFSKYDKVTVIALRTGRYFLPGVTVYDLGHGSRFSKIKRFLALIWALRVQYKTVLVHMNQEYVLLGGLFWRLYGAKILLWRNHSAGSILTRLAVLISHKTFCTSRYAYIAHYKKNKIMPVGIDTDVFRQLKEEESGLTALFVGRLAPIKRPHFLVQAISILLKQNVPVICDFYGPQSERDIKYTDSLAEQIDELAFTGGFRIFGPISNNRLPEIYNQHKVCVNLTRSGALDKTIFEAMACGCLILTCSDDLKSALPDKFFFKHDDLGELVTKLRALLEMSPEETAENSRLLRKFVVNEHSLQKLGRKLSGELK